MSKYAKKGDSSADKRSSFSHGKKKNHGPAYENIPLNGRIDVMENMKQVIDLDASDDHNSEGNGLQYSIVGGKDREFYKIDRHTGKLSFTNPPDFENPRDKNGDNIYDVIVRVVDSHGAYTDQPLWVKVTDKPDTPINKDPAAVDDHATVEAGGQVGIRVLDNDSDPDGDNLRIKFSATDKISANGGAIKLNNNGTPHNFADDRLVYRPAEGFTGVDTFHYAISDGNGGMDRATVKINVEAANQDPVAVDDHAMVESGEQVGIKVLDNDSDPDGDDLRIKFAATDKISANGGTIKLNNNGTPHNFADDRLVYRPAEGFTGVDTFHYAIGDGNGGMDRATVKINVEAANKDPAAVDDHATVEAGGQVGIRVLDNDSDPDGDNLRIKFSATDKISANGGTIKLNNNGTPHNFADDRLVYRPAEGFTGVDTFHYAISDGNGGMDRATVKVDVKPPRVDLAIAKEFIPTFQNEFKIATYGENISFTLTATNNSSGTAKNVVITDEIAQLENITISDLPLGGSYTIDPITNILKISIPELAGGKEATFTVSGDVVVPEELVIFNFFGQLDNDNSGLQEYASAVIQGTEYFDLNLTKEIGSPIVRFNFNTITNSANIDAENIVDPNLSNNKSSDTAEIAQAEYIGTLANGDEFQKFVVEIEPDPIFQTQLDPINAENPSDLRPFIDVDWGKGGGGRTTNSSQFLDSDAGEQAVSTLFLNWDNATEIEKGVPGGLLDQFLALEADGDLKDSSDEQAVLDFLETRIFAGDASSDKFIDGNLQLLNTTTEEFQETEFTQGQYTQDLGQSDIVNIVVTSNGVFETDSNGDILPDRESLGKSLQEGLDNLDPAANAGTVLNIVIDDSVTQTRLQTLSFNSLADKGYFVQGLEIQSDSVNFKSFNHPANIDLSLIEVTEASPNSLTLTGGHAKDSFIGSNLSETVYGGNEKDKIAGGMGNDLLFGGQGNDLIRGDGGNDIIIGGAGNDVLRGSFGQDTLIGGYYDPESDYIYKKGGDIYVLEENAGLDTVKSFAKHDAIGLLDIEQSELDFRVEHGSTIISLEGEDLMLIEGIDDPHDLNFTSEFHVI